MPTRASLTARRPTATELLAIPWELAATAHAQAGIVTRNQLRGVGVTLAQVENRLAATRWSAIGRNVVVAAGAVVSTSARRTRR